METNNERNNNKKTSHRTRNDSRNKKSVRTAEPRKYDGKSAWMSDSRTRNANDVRWYANNPEQLKSAASLSWTGISGQSIFGFNESVPGVMVLDWFPAIGGEDYLAINQAASSMYSFVVHANSRNYKYDANDLILMVLAGASAFSGFAEGVRVFGIMNRYNGIDLYTPRALVKALGFDFDDLRDNLSRMWFDLNHLAGKLQQIWIPNVMPVVERWFWMNSNIYRDADSAKAQYYVFRQSAFYTLSEVGSEEGTSLVINSAKLNRPVDRKWTEYMAMMNEMIDALVAAQDRGMIFGDILNAYGASKLYAVSSIDVNYQTPISYNTEVLSQIENATVCDVEPGNIVQDINHLRIFQQFELNTYANFATTTTGCRYLPDDGILNFHQLTDPTPEQIMVATRLRSAGLMIADIDLSDPNSKKISLKPVVNGTEIVSNIMVYKMTYDGNIPRVSEPIHIDTNLSDKEHGKMYEWCAFDWAPWMYKPESNGRVVPTKPAAGYVFNRLQPKQCYGDWDNWSVITREELAKLHTTALLSEFGVPFSLQ